MKVLICMATWNREKYLHKAITNILDQTHINWELVITDDGSKDKTARVVRPFLQDKRIQYINEGKSDYYTINRNRCLKYSDAPLIAFHDDDIIWKPDFLKELIKPFRNNEVIMTYCGRYLHYQHKWKDIDLDELDKIPVFQRPAMKQYQGVDTLSDEVDINEMVVRRSALLSKDWIFDPKFRDKTQFCSDAWLVDALADKNPQGRVVLIRKRLVHYFLDHGGSQMTLRKIEDRKKGLFREEERWEY